MYLLRLISQTPRTVEQELACLVRQLKLRLGLFALRTHRRYVGLKGIQFLRRKVSYVSAKRQ